MEKINRKSLKENQKIEFKKSFAERKEILQTISAFTNTDGGTIFVGIEENKNGSIKKVVGTSVKGRTIEKFLNKVKQNTDPVIFPSIEIENINGIEIVKIEVEENPIKPVFVKGEVYRRVGKTNQKLSTLEIRDLTRESVDYNFTELLCEDAKVDDIDDKKIKEFVKKAKKERKFSLDYNSKKDFLKKMNLIAKSRLKYSAILLFGKTPQRYILQSEIRCGRFKGTKPFEFDDMEVIQGTLVEQVDRVMTFIKRNLKLEATFDGSIERKEKWEYPLLAIREGITNAICHRDYSSNSNVQVRIFDDRLEIWSPGGLPKNISVEDLKREHESVPRNREIANTFFMVKFIEQWGTGTNKIIQWTLDHGLPEPEFVDKKRVFVVIIRKDKFTEEYLKSLDLNGRQIKAVMFVKENKSITRKDYEKINKISKRTAIRDLNELIKKGILKGVGTTDNRRYVFES